MRRTSITIRRLNKALQDPSYRRTWIANIAMSYIGCERWYMEKHNKTYLNRTDKHIIANRAAENFLNLLNT